MDGKVVKSKSGATSTALDDRYDLIPYAAIRAIARRFGVGAKKHAPRNWELGDQEFAETRLNHCMRHMARFVEYRQMEDLDAVLCNASMLAYWKDLGLLPSRGKPSKE